MDICWRVAFITSVALVGACASAETRAAADPPGWQWLIIAVAGITSDTILRRRSATICSGVAASREEGSAAGGAAEGGASGGGGEGRGASKGSGRRGCGGLRDELAAGGTDCFVAGAAGEDELAAGGTVTGVCGAASATGCSGWCTGG